MNIPILTAVSLQFVLLQVLCMRGSPPPSVCTTAMNITLLYGISTGGIIVTLSCQLLCILVTLHSIPQTRMGNLKELQQYTNHSAPIMMQCSVMKTCADICLTHSQAKGQPPSLVVHRMVLEANTYTMN